MLGLCLTVVVDFTITKLVRRTFVFYTPDTGHEIVEERMIAYTGSLETDMSRYVEEAILGPLSLETVPLLSRGSRLESLLLRENIVYLSISEEAAIPPPSGQLSYNLTTMKDGLRRNFPIIKEVRVFIAGNEILTE
ncbi:MAG: hypothetical protein LBH18_01025 [Spirochaetaceae bacterium]|nr:hypothetical protein [Spirochaetaceae bacterium]